MVAQALTLATCRVVAQVARDAAAMGMQHDVGEDQRSDDGAPVRVEARFGRNPEIQRRVGGSGLER